MKTALEALATMLSCDYIQAARGLLPSDTELAHCRVTDFFRNIIVEDVSVYLYKGYIVGVGDQLPAASRVDLDGAYLCPGLVDSHVHIESSLLSPTEYARLVSPRGTTAVVADPHEIANVLGYDGMLWMLRASEGLPISMYFMAPSCVPATGFDTAGASLQAADLAAFTMDKRILGLGEVMNYPGVLACDPQLMEKLSLFLNSHAVIDGHGPGLRGKDLSAYVLAGIHSDHEATSPAEALEKLGKGMWIMARMGSGARDLEALIPAMNADTCRRMLLCTDDRHPEDLAGEGHIDAAIRALVSGGIPWMDALRMACHNPASYFGLKQQGAIAPGYKADLVAFRDPHEFSASLVYKAGTLVAKDGYSTSEPTGMPGATASPPPARDSVNIKWLTKSDFVIPWQSGKARVIECSPGSIVTGHGLTEPSQENGVCVSDTARDILRIYVIERHTGSGAIGKGFIRGLGLKRGAIGSTVSHDSHNMIIAGVDDESIFKAARRLNAMRGGFVACEGDDVMAELALPIAGLMSEAPSETVIAAMEQFARYFRENEVPGSSPLMSLSFMALPVIPSLKLCDQGLVDVDQFRIVPLFVEHSGSA